MPTGRILSLAPRTSVPTWTFLTNHAHVLVCLAADPTARLRDVAARVGITERAVQHIVADLEEGGLLTRARQGRRNRYTLHRGISLRHPVEAHVQVGELLGMILPLPGHDAIAEPDIAAAVEPEPRAPESRARRAGGQPRGAAGMRRAGEGAGV